MTDWPSPERLDALIDGRDTPRTDAEREALLLAAELTAGEPALPTALDARIDDIVRSAGPGARAPWWRRIPRPGLVAGPVAAVAAAVVVAVAVVIPGGDGPRPWYESSELAGDGSPPRTELLSDVVTGPAAPDSTATADGGAREAAPPEAPAAPRAAPPDASAGSVEDGELVPFVETAGPPLKVRSGPGSGFPQVGTVPDGARLRIVCVTTGTEVIGPFGGTRVWDRLSDGGYVSDAFVFTGGDGPTAPECD